MKNNVIAETDVINILVHLEEIVIRLSEEDDKSFIIEEITENIFILITENKKRLHKFDIWNTIIIPNIHTISTLRKNDINKYKSMTGRATFKYMDIIDELAKK